MTDIDAVFNDAYMRKRRYMAWRGPVIAKAIVEVFHPESVIDIGCSVGEIPAALIALGVDAWGLDGSEAAFRCGYLPAERFIQEDLRTPHRWKRHFDLATCFETLSVIDEKDHAMVMKNLSSIADRILAGRLPFEPNGYVEAPEKADEFRKLFEQLKDKAAVKAIYNSARYFVRHP